MTHAVIAFYRGEWGLALKHNFLVFPLIGGFNFLVMAWVFQWDPSWFSYRRQKRAAWIVLVLLLIFSIVRNLVEQK